jgi:hypothetical protein
MRRPRFSNTRSRTGCSGLLLASWDTPLTDPHGDPIPFEELEVEEPDARSLEALPVGSSGRLVRVLERDAGRNAA